MEDMKDLLDMQLIEKSTDGAQELKSPLGQFTNCGCSVINRIIQLQGEHFDPKVMFVP
jgi:translation initiation factor 1 (eIF-1/SUI1)